MEVEKFIERWAASGGSEMATAQSFAIELTELLGVDRPNVSDKDGDFLDYRFERPVTLTHTGRKRNGRIDLYKKGHFILEAKQFVSATGEDKSTLEKFFENNDRKQVGHGKRNSARFDDTMLKARNQADSYARAVSKDDGWPPFLMVVDVGHVIELYADFSRQGQGYNQFPDGNRYRIYLKDLREAETRELLRSIWTAPYSLDPALQAAKVTREIAEHLAELGKSFEAQGHESETVARFLMRCLFSMFAEDVNLIPKRSFTDLLIKLQSQPQHAQPSLQGLWETMNDGGFSQVLMTDLMRFNGGLFKEPKALPLDNMQLGLLIEAAEADWKQVEPAIFGTLLERALDKKQRHKLGAHYTPRAYVERLVTPTIIEPLREDWRHVQLSVQRLTTDGKTDEALKTVRNFHNTLCEIRVLDPACGSGNFLYVALEMMKRLEGEVTALMEELGERQTSFITVDPHQFLGIELNPWAANVAELVLWIGYLQWHFRTHGKAAPSEPVLRDFKNIKNADAILDWECRTPRIDGAGNPITRWDGITTMQHPVTGEEVPDPDARIQVYDYSKPKAVNWPEATFIVGNPPFIGAARLRDSLGDGYIEALWKAYPKMPQSADLVMFWWEKAALAARSYVGQKRKGTRRFGLITTNSLRQTFNRRVLEPHLKDPKSPLSLLFAIPDHPWVDTLYGAAVRIAMTVGTKGNREGQLLTIAAEGRHEINEADGKPVNFDQQQGKIFANLQIGPDVLSAKPLRSNVGLSARGAFLVGKGFLGSKSDLLELAEGSDAVSARIVRPFLGGYDLTQRNRERWVVDFWGLSENESRLKYPKLYQRLLETVKPVRDENNMPWRKENWWVFGDPSRSYRAITKGKEFVIVTSRTAKFRCFQLCHTANLCESEVVVVGMDETWVLSVLSSNIHETWSLSVCGWMGIGNDPRYNNSKIFDPFPFPVLTEAQKSLLSKLGKELDAHRKQQQVSHPELTLTQMYNVLKRLRAGEKIEGKDKEIYHKGLIGILRDIHDRIDLAVADAYSWPANLSNEEILFKIVALNKERTDEEAQGHVRWLRPEYQNPTGIKASKGRTKEIELSEVSAVEKDPWPKTMPEQFAAVQNALVEMGEATPEQIARKFKRARTKSIQPLLESLVALGRAEQIDDGHFAA
mgnify:CR=1 FL=1